MKKTPRRILVAGAGIAGLTAALAFARDGFETTIIERAERLTEIGAGLQLSPNATRILAGFGVLDRLLSVSTRPRSVALRDAVSLALLAEVPLGIGAEERWKAPYLVLHRADLQ
ncbi:MAG: FAD-dependent monooxygenase, partial [Rhizobiaceae bacterium]